MRYVDEQHELRGLDDWITYVPDHIDDECYAWDEPDPRKYCEGCSEYFHIDDDKIYCESCQAYFDSLHDTE